MMKQYRIVKIRDGIRNDSNFSIGQIIFRDKKGNWYLPHGKYKKRHKFLSYFFNHLFENMLERKHITTEYRYRKLQRRQEK